MYVSFLLFLSRDAMRFPMFRTNIDSTWIRNDVQVKLKKRYNDSFKSSKCLLSGSEWYCHQAFRALNQAAGF
jgi:Fanconi anemia group J protein